MRMVKMKQTQLLSDSPDPNGPDGGDSRSVRGTDWDD